jgi:glutathione S-transferase
LYSPPGSFRAFAPLIVAEYNGIEIEVESRLDQVKEAIASKSPTAKAPILVCGTDGQVIFSSNAMCRYLAGLRKDTGLLGTSLKERMAIDEWMDWTLQDVELPACVWWYSCAGYIPDNPEA